MEKKKKKKKHKKKAQEESGSEDSDKPHERMSFTMSCQFFVNVNCVWHICVT